MTYRMVNSTYTPRKAEQTVFADALGIQDFQNLLIDGGDLGDNKVVVTIEKASQECKDRYTIERKPQGNFFLNTEKCVGGKLSQPQISEVPPKDSKTIALNALFLPDANFHNAKLPESWMKARALADKPQSLEGLPMWHFADPKLRPLRRQWARSDDKGITISTTEGPLLGVKAPPPEESEAWKNFAIFLETMEPRLIEGLQGSLSSQKIQENFRLAIPYFETLLEDIKKGNYNIEKLNRGFQIAFDKETLEFLNQLVRNLVYSEYPYAPPTELDKMAKVLNAWVPRAYIMINLARGQKDLKIPITQNLTSAQIAVSKNQLGEILENPGSTTPDIEALRATYQKDLWVSQFQVPSAQVLIHPDTVTAFEEEANGHFDRTIAVPALQDLIKKIPDLKAEKGLQLGQQVSTILRLPDTMHFDPKEAKKALKQVEKGEAKLHWKVEHVRNQFEALVVAQNFPDASKDQAISILSNRFGKRATWHLNLNDADFVLQTLKDLKASLPLEKAIAQALLDLNEGRQIKITPTARQTFELSLSNDFGGKELPAAPAAKPAPKKVAPAIEVKKGPIEGIDWENLRDQAMGYYKNKDEEKKKLALPQLKQAAAAQAGSDQWKEGKGWENCSDWATLDSIAKVAWDFKQIEDAFIARKKTVALAATPKQKEESAEKLEAIRKRIGSVTITQDPNQADSVQKGYIVLISEKVMINLEGKVALEQAVDKLSTKGVSLPLTVYLTNGKYEANGIPFEIKLGEKEPSVTLRMYKDLPSKEVFSWSQWLSPSVMPGMGVARLFRSRLAANEAEKPVTVAEKK